MTSAARKISLGMQARHWPNANGLILKVASKDSSDSESHSREIQVRYAYTVAGQRYEGTTVHPAYTSSSFESSHHDIEALLTSGKMVRVYYDERNPERSTLSTGFYSGSLAMVSAGFIFFGAGVGFLFTFWFMLAGNWNFARGITMTG